MPILLMLIKAFLYCTKEKIKRSNQQMKLLLA